MIWMLEYDLTSLDMFLDQLPCCSWNKFPIKQSDFRYRFGVRAGLATVEFSSNSSPTHLNVRVFRVTKMFLVGTPQSFGTPPNQTHLDQLNSSLKDTPISEKDGSRHPEWVLLGCLQEQGWETLYQKAIDRFLIGAKLCKVYLEGQSCPVPVFRK